MASEELRLFDKADYTRRLASYRAEFAGHNGQRAIGEATPSYMMPNLNPHAMATRIRATLPRVKLIALLRNPVDRSLSAMHHHINKGRLAPGTRLLDYVQEVDPRDDPLQLIAGSWYATSLKPYIEIFGLDRLLVLRQDEALTSPQDVYARTLRFLELYPTFAPSSLARVRFSNQSKLRQWRRLLTHDDLSAAERDSLFDYFADDVAELETLLGLELTSWRPPPC